MQIKKDNKLGSWLIKFLLTPIILLIFLTVVFYWSSSQRNLPKLQSSDKTSAVRGSIISLDGYKVARSQKLYKVEVDTRSIDKDKLDLFVKLYTIYTNDKPKRVKKLIQNTKGRVVLSYKISPKIATHLKELAHTLNQKKVFISFMTKDGKFHPPIGMSIIESGENRRYLANDSMSPFLGYIKKVEVDDITRVRGVKGVEKFYDYYLFATKDQILKGPRDIGNNIIIEKNSIKSIREDGYDAILNIPLKLQKEIELLLSKNALKYDATEIVAAIMNSKTGEILTLATSMRYNPSNITRKDYDALNLTATEYPYEPGSVIKPIIFSIVYENNKVGLNDIINTHNGSYKLGSRIIKDTNPQKSLSATDVVVKSSNIGMIEITSKLDNIKLFEGLLKYNLSNKTGIDMPYEQAGNIPTLNMLQNTSNKATISYGYGLQATFMQILNAFAIYNNDGVMITPRVVKYLQKDGKIYNLNEPAIKEVISKKTADAIKHILIETVNKGTGRKAITKGLVVGGKTGTARIAQKGEYTRLYNSSFFGFANDGNVSYTIGVLVREPKKGSYYAAQNALPVFKEIIDLLIKDNYLKPFKDENFEEIDHEILNSIKD